MDLQSTTFLGCFASDDDLEHWDLSDGTYNKIEPPYETCILPSSSVHDYLVRKDANAACPLTNDNMSEHAILTTASVTP